MNTARLPVWFMVVTLLAAACDSAKPENPASGPAASSEPPPPPPPAAAPPPAPTDIDATALLKHMDCPKPQRRGACRVVEGFAKAGALNWKRPARKARWVGYLYTVDQGKEKRELVILHGRELPTAQAGLGALPLRIGTGGFPEELEAHAERLVSARSRKSGPSPRNLAPRFVSDFEPTKDFSAIQTDGPSILTVEAEPAYIREQDKTVFYVKPDDTNPGHSSDGIYAELWMETW